MSVAASPQVVRLRVVADASSVRRAREAVDAALTRAGWGADDRQRVLLAAGEALANAVEHGSVEGAPVDVSIRTAGACARVAIRDHGRAGARYPTSRPAAPPPTNTRGRGRLIIDALADRVAVRRTACGTYVSVAFERPAHSPVVWAPCPICRGQTPPSNGSRTPSPSRAPTARAGRGASPGESGTGAVGTARRPRAA